MKQEDVNKSVCSLDEVQRTKFGWTEVTRHILVTLPSGHHFKQGVHVIQSILVNSFWLARRAECMDVFHNPVALSRWIPARSVRG